MKLNIEVHPVADLFPMLPADELQDLAEDIKTRGQLQPIVLDAEGRILDGRNRFAACQIAEVEPKFSTFDGEDPEGYALAVNIARREMNKEQKAIVLVKAQSFTVKDRGKQARSAKAMGISEAHISKAKAVVQEVPDEANRILDGIQHLRDAYEKAVAKRKARQEEEDNLAALRSEDPELAEDVTEGRITFPEALAELDRRREDAKRAERVAAIDVLVDEAGGDALNFTQRVEAGQLTWTEAENLANQWKREFDDAVDRNCRRIENVASGWAALSRLLDAPDDQFNKAVAAKLGDTLTAHVDAIRNEIFDKSEKWEGTTK